MINNSPLVYIILINYNGIKDTIECLKSIMDISYSNYKIVIVDNDSLDNSITELKSYIRTQNIEYTFFQSPKNAIEDNSLKEKISVIQSSFNGGYAYGNNIGIRYGLKQGAEYFLILNNDTVVQPNFLEPLIDITEKDNNIGIASGKILFYDRPDTIWFNGGVFYPYSGRIEHINFKEKDVGQKPKVPLSFISGCMWLIPRRVINNVGLMNEEYFMYLEDLDYCQRVLKKGFSLHLNVNSIIYHKVGGSTGGEYSSFSIYHRTRNMNKILFKSKGKILKYSSLIIFNLLVIFKILKSKKGFLFRDYFKALYKVNNNNNVT